MRFALAIESQVLPGFTNANFLQLATIPGCVGVGVAIPFPVDVGVGGTVGVCPMTPTQAYVEAQRPEQSLPAAGFQDTNWEVEMEYSPAIVAQVWPPWTKWNLLQLVTMLTWVGRGVVTPFPGGVVVVEVVAVVEVGDGSTPMMEMQA